MPKKQVPFIGNDKITLKLLTLEDLPLTREWRNHNDIRRWFFHSDIISEAQHNRWFQNYLERDDDYVFVIYEIERLCRPVGQIALYNIDWLERRAEYGRLMIGDMKARGQGLARIATDLLLEFSFSTWELSEVYLEVFADNLAAIRLYEACGFVVSKETDGIKHMHRVAKIY
ncbi:MAG: GNAT family N-acetyltransferase [Ardenticatenaceae bacterium]|nr:GNAT family N-acetyltransferase [Ardenticatenaceae bacterium]